MSSTGLTWCFEVLSALDPWSEDTISRPAVMLVVYAPSDNRKTATRSLLTRALRCGHRGYGDLSSSRCAVITPSR